VPKRRLGDRLAIVTCVCSVFFSPLFARAQQNTVTGRIQVQTGQAAQPAKSAAAHASEVVLWLVPLDSAPPDFAASGKRVQLVQKNKSFQPHLVVVRVGSTVDFPNRDPFFHNVFSLFDGKRFDLGLYEAGATNSVRFDREGVSYLFCNIHPEMSAVVVAVATPYYGVSDKSGAVSIPNVPDGRYELHLWYERSLPEDLKHLVRPVRISSTSHDLGMLAVPLNPNFTASHKNKYGQDYPPPPAQGYGHP